MPRKKIPENTISKLLLLSRRRCAICFGLNRDSEVKRGQIAHLDHDHSNNDLANLAFLCLEHHDIYDSTSRQSKGWTAAEVKVFKAELEEALTASLSTPLPLAPVDSSTDAWEGVYRFDDENSSAEIQIEIIEANRFLIRGMAFWGTTRSNGPNFGEIDAEIEPQGGRLQVKAEGAVVALTRTLQGLAAEEIGEKLPFGMNVSFAGLYRRVAPGADAIAQPRLRSFESEFWPEEGIPVFVARQAILPLHARPVADAPIVSQLNVQVGQRVEFSGFRYRTLRPGRMIALSNGTLVGRNLGETDYVSRSNYYEDGGEIVSMQFGKGDHLEYLQYRAEGTGFLRLNGLVLDAELPWSDPESPLRLLTEPVAESWIRVTGRHAAISGWLLVDEFLDEVDRAF